MSQSRLVVASVRLTSKHVPTGRTRHIAGAELLPTPTELRIVQYDGDPGFLLLYLDADRQELTDTYHSTLEGAFAQAEFEFGVKPDDWLRDAS